MKFYKTSLKSVRADLGKKEIIVSFSCAMTVESEMTAQDLAVYLQKGRGGLAVDFQPFQMAMNLDAIAFRLTHNADPDTGEIKTSDVHNDEVENNNTEGED